MDIVERLRLFAKDDATTAALYDVAVRRADEIERLREALEKICHVTGSDMEAYDIAENALKEKE